MALNRLETFKLSREKQRESSLSLSLDLEIGNANTTKKVLFRIKFIEGNFKTKLRK